jgi:hypothetical protein
MVHHKQHSKDHLKTFQKSSSKSSDHSEIVSCAQTDRDEKENCEFYMKVSLVSRRQFIPWKLFLWWKFINQYWYSLYFACKIRELIHESQRGLPPHPNFLPFVLVVYKHKNEDFNTCFGYLLLQIKFIILIIFLSSQLMQRNKAVSLSWQYICLYILYAFSNFVNKPTAFFTSFGLSTLLTAIFSC